MNGDQREDERGADSRPDSGGIEDKLTAELRRELAALHLENLRIYGKKARECLNAGRFDRAARFRTFAVESGREWLALVAPDAAVRGFGTGQRASALRLVAQAYAAGQEVVTNLQLVP